MFCRTLANTAQSYRTVCVYCVHSTVCWSMLSVGYFCKRTFYRNTVKWVHIYLYSCTVFAVHGLRFSAVSGHFCMVVIKSVLKLETQIYIKCHPNKSKEKLCYSYVYNATHSHQKFPVRHSILPPNPKRRQFAQLSVLILLLWGIL